MLTYSLVVGCYRYCGCIRIIGADALSSTPESVLVVGGLLARPQFERKRRRMIWRIWVFTLIFYADFRPHLVSVILVVTDKKITLIFYADFTPIFDDWNGP